MQIRRQYEPLFPGQAILQYDAMFMERLLENLGNIPTSMQNKVFLQRKAKEYPLTQVGYEQEGLVRQLKGAERIVRFSGNNWEEREQRKDVEIDDSIVISVKDAGEYVIRELMGRINGFNRNGDLENLSKFRIGVLELSPHYAGNNSDNYIETANSVWRSRADQMLTDRVASIRDAAEKVTIDPYEAPRDAENRRHRLNEQITKCGLDLPIMPDGAHREGEITEQADWQIEDIMRDMYQKAYDILLPQTLEKIHALGTIKDTSKGLDGILENHEMDVDDVLRDIRLTFEYGSKLAHDYRRRSGFNIEDIRDGVQSLRKMNEWSGSMQVNVGKALQNNPEGFYCGDESIIEAQKTRGQQLIDTPKRIHQAIEDAMESLERSRSLQPISYEQAPMPRFDKIPLPKEAEDHFEKFPEDFFAKMDEIQSTNQKGRSTSAELDIKYPPII